MLKKAKKLAKDLLSVPAIRKLYEKTNLLILNIFGSSRVLGTVYAIFGFATFNREQFSVLRARRDYYRLVNKAQYNSVGLRRNVHRLEKGLIMQPARPVFAADYILETIDFYQKSLEAYKSGYVDTTELTWAHDVLTRYFATVDTSNAKVERARTAFEALKSAFNPNHSREHAPYAREDSVEANVSYEELLKLAERRRSVRWFTEKKVPHDIIEKALLVARQAPSACNRLPYKFRVFDEPKQLKKVAGIPFGAAGYAHQVPTMIVVTGDLKNYFSPRDRHTIYIDASLAVMSFILSLETMGVSSSIINWPDFEPLEVKMQKTLGLKYSERVVMMIAVGYADTKGGIPFSQKKPLESLATFNELQK